LHTVENRTSEITNELLQQVGLLGGDLVEAIALATAFSLVAGKTSSELSVEDCIVS
jgi:Na+(H+)/acetate symporter ActP